jgi:1-deoxy-D-xylulose 5-phosphate reductoisomerase
VLLGATGSIGTQAVDVVRDNPTASGSWAWPPAATGSTCWPQQALELGVEVVAVARATAAQDLQLAFYAARRPRVQRRASSGPCRRSWPARTPPPSCAAVGRATWCSTA